MSHETLTIHAQALRRFIRDALAAVGLAAADAETAADVLATADEFGVTTHGVKLLPGYLRRLSGGGARPNGQPKVISAGPAWALVDGDSALGVLIGVFGMQTAIAKASSAGIAYVGVRNSGHFAAAGYYSSLNPALSLTASSGLRIQWTDADSVLVLPDPDSSGNSVRYVIQRMCRNANVAIQNADCLFSGALQDLNGKNIPLPQDVCIGAGCPVAGQTPQIRITSRTTGPRNTISYVQAFVY